MKKAVKVYTLHKNVKVCYNANDNIVNRTKGGKKQ